MAESGITLDQIANDWLDPDFQYQDSVYDDFDWSYNYDTYEPGPSLNIPWREQPTTPTSYEVITPYTTQKSWLDTLGEVFKVVGPTAMNIIETIYKPEPTAPVLSKAPVLSTPSPGSSQPIILQTGTTQPAPSQPIIVVPGTGQQTGTSSPIFVQQPGGAAATPNYILYAVIGLAAVFLMRK